MASSIEWCDDTWNPTTGCTKISKECDNCYAEVATHIKQSNPLFDKYKMGFDVFVEHPDALQKPVKRKKPTTYFVNSMSDLFHKDATLDFIKGVFKIMNDTPHHTYQVLTKRHHELTQYASELIWTDNIWMGVSVGDNIGKRRIKHLVDCPAKHKFLSIEPLIEKLEDLNLTGIDLVYVGGESGDGPSIRPMEAEWVYDIIDTCKEQGIKFFFKQWGKNRNNPDPTDPTMNHSHPYYSKGGCQINAKILRDNPCMKGSDTKYIELFGNEYLVIDEYEDLNSNLNTIWELKSYLPMMEPELFNELKTNIRNNGLHDPILYITTQDNKKLVIEGHTRLKACIELGVYLPKVPTKEIKEVFSSLEEIQLWMVKHQNQRRNLSTLDKIKLAYLSKPIIEKVARENQSKAGKLKSNMGEIDEEMQKVDTNLEIAKVAGVGKSTAMMYSQLMDHAPKNLMASLDKGEISIKSAYNTVKDKKIADIKQPKVKAEPIIKENTLVELESFEDGYKKFEADEVDILVKDRSMINLFKNNTGIVIGVFIDL